MVTSTKMMSPASGRSLSSTICLSFSQYSMRSRASGSLATRRMVRRAQSRRNRCEDVVEDDLGGAQLEGAQEAATAIETTMTR